MLAASRKQAGDNTYSNTWMTQLMTSHAVLIGIRLFADILWCPGKVFHISNIGNAGNNSRRLVPAFATSV